MYPASAGTTMPKIRTDIAGTEPIFPGSNATVNNLYPEIYMFGEKRPGRIKPPERYKCEGESRTETRVLLLLRLFCYPSSTEMLEGDGASVPPVKCGLAVGLWRICLCCLLPPLSLWASGGGTWSGSLRHLAAACRNSSPETQRTTGRIDNNNTNVINTVFCRSLLYIL